MKNNFFDKIIEISDKIKSAKDLRESLNFICDTVHKVMNFKISSIVLYDGVALVISVYKGYVPDKTVFTPEEWFTGDNINPKGDCYIVDKADGSKSVSFVLRTHSDKVLGFLRGIMPGGAQITEEGKGFLGHCAFLTAILVESNKLHSEKNMNENLQIIGMLKSSVVHDISNLLGIVEVYLELAEKESGGNSTVTEYMGSVRSELKRVNVIARDLLDFSKQSLNLHKSVFLLTEFAKELENYCKMLVKDTGVDIIFEIEENLEMNGDKDRLFRVFFNLINNAADALHNHGIVVLKIKRSGNNIVFLVVDNGKGIKKESLGMLFDPFFTSGKAKGSGLGLAVVKEIVSAHSGSVRVRSVEGKYTCFLIRIPK